MKALVIAPQPFFSPRGTPFSVYYRTLVTSQLGVEVDLLTYGEGQDVDIPGVRIIRIPRFKSLGNVKTGPSVLKLFLDQFMLLWTIGLLLRNRYDFVHAHEESIFWARFMKPMFRYKLIYDMHSSLPQQLSNFDFSESRLLTWIFKKLEDTAIRASDAIITICPALADYVDDLIGKQDKHLLIENSIFETVKLAQDSVSTSSNNPEQTSSEEKLVPLPEGRKYVVYTGTLETYQGIDVLVTAFSKVLETNPEAYLIVVGGNPEQVQKYSAMAQGLSDNCVFTGRVSQPLAKHYNNIATVLMSPRTAGTNTPLKVYEQLASGKPLVATSIYSHTQVLDDSVAFLVEPTADDMACGISRVLSAPEEAAEKVANAQKLYEDKYSRVAYEAKMRRLMQLVS